MNIQKMMKQAQAMQSKMADIQAKMELQEAEGQAGGGMVKAVVTGKGVAKKITIDDSLMEKSEKEMLEDLIVAAFNDAKKKADATMEQEMSSLTAGLQLPPGMKMPF